MSASGIVRQAVPPGRPYTTYRQQLREDFWYACAYCSMTEAEASAIRFEIDHFQPRALGGSDDYSNLYYACEHCNGHKTSMPSISDTYSIVRIDLEDPDEHLELQQDSTVAHKTEKGRHNILVLELNRRALRSLREQRRRLAYSRETIAHGLRALSKVHIDMLPMSARAKLLSLRKQVADQAQLLDDQIDELIRQRCRSPLVDPDPEHSKQNSERRAHLKSIGAWTPKSSK